MQLEGSEAPDTPAAQLAALDRVMAIAEFDPDGTLRSANGNYRAILGFDRNGILGRHHSSFCPEPFAGSQAYTAFWNALLDGASHSGIVERLRRDGSSCWLEATYAPVLGPAGDIRRILKVATDVSDRVRGERVQQERLQRLSMVADASDTAIAINDAASGILYVNAGFSRMFGWTNEEVLGRNFIALLAPQLDAEDVAAVRARLLSGHSVQREEIVTARDGQRYWAKVVSNPVLDDTGRLRNTVNLLTDITLSKMHETLQHQVLEAMARERPLIEVLELICVEVERIAPEIAASILAVDAQGRLHPLAAPSLPQSYCRQLDGVSIGERVGSCGTAAWRNETVCVDDIATDPLWTDYRALVLPLGLGGCWSTPIRDSRGKVVGTFAFYFRQTRNTSSVVFHQRLIDACTHLCSLALERERARQRIRQLAFYDGLTGMPNRSQLQARADQAIAAAGRDGRPLAVVFVDLDRFKQVNDSLGHPAGDELLRHVSTRLRESLRGEDIAGRLSGDEFVLVLPRRDSADATDTVERLQQRLAAPLSIAGTPLAVSTSIGIAMFPADGRDMETLLHRADMAMHQAKATARGRFRFFSDEMNTLAQERLALEAALREALRGRRLDLHYQPQVDLGSGRLYGVEALARWTHPQFGAVPPARFIPLAEECGLIAELGTWTLHEACRQLADWRARGLAVPAVSVNLSATSFHDLDLPRTIAGILRDHGLAPQHLTLELTEDIVLDTNPGTMKTLADLHDLGVRLSMDDFGTGYSSLGYLRRLPISELKLDRSFVADLAHDAAARALSSAILGIGRSLHLTVVAEGVETASQHALLREQGYPVAQGYLFSRPRPATSQDSWLAGLPAGESADDAEPS